MSPGLKSTNLYGPVPTGFRLLGASRDLAPLYGSKRCFGITMPRMPTNGSAQLGVGLANTTRTVWASTFSTVQSLYEPTLMVAVAGSEAYSQLNTRSSAVNGLPSCHCTPFLIFQVTDFPSFASAPFCRLG